MSKVVDRSLDPYLISTIFWVIGMTWSGIERRSLRPLVNTVLIWPMQQIRAKRSQMIHLLTWLPSWIFLVKASQLCLPHFIGECLMQQVGCICDARMTCPTHLQQWCLSVVPGWPAQHICKSGVYSPIYSPSKWQWESCSTCVSDHSQVNQYSLHG